MSTKTDIYVYAHWIGMPEPKTIGVLSAQQDFELAKSVGKYFRLEEKQMAKIIQEVKQATSNWKTIAKELGIPGGEIELMTKAFNS